MDAYVRQRFIYDNVTFFHAMNLRGFSIYCREQALVSRARIMQIDKEYTRFLSDDRDARIGVLDRIFGHIADYGDVFSEDPQAVPNVYGPVTLHFKSSVFRDMSDIALTSRGLLSDQEDWSKKRLTDQSRIDELLAADIPLYSRVSAELSCREDRLDFRHLEAVIVEPIAVCGRSLASSVKHLLMKNHHWHVRVITRDYTQHHNQLIYQDLVDHCTTYVGVLSPERMTENLRMYYDSLSEYRQHRLNQWCSYFYTGTVWFTQLNQGRQQDTSTTEDR